MTYHFPLLLFCFPVTIGGGNIENPNLTIDKKDEITSVYALSDGEASNQVLFLLESGMQNDTPYARREYKIEARESDRSSVTEIYTKALSTLSERKAKKEFGFAVIPNAGGAEYRVDFDLGDIVTIQWGSVTESIRITEIIISIDSSGESIEIGVSDDD